MKRKTISRIHQKVRLLFCIMMGIGFLLLSYLILLIAFSDGNFKHNALSILVIALCTMGQISHYHEAYREIKKGMTYYIGIIPPIIALTCLVFAVSKVYFFA